MNKKDKKRLVILLLIAIVIFVLGVTSACSTSSKPDCSVTYYIRTMDNKTIVLTNEDVVRTKANYDVVEFSLADGTTIITSFSNVTIYTE